MTAVNRRRFLQMTGGAAALTMLDASIARAAAIPANRRTGTLRDVEHIVVLMQENRSFDHYFGTLRGVRGFGDPRPVTLPSGKSVFHQSDGTNEVLPWHPEVSDLGLKFLDGLDHSWNGGHKAWNGGKYDQWIPAKGPGTMGHFTRDDIPFHYALADAFTICDAYHCSLMTCTDPNRYYMWTGYTGNDGVGGGPVLTNAEAGYNWTTYPERLEKAGVSWKIYQDAGDGLDGPGYWGWTGDAFIGNYGDNSLLYFDNYRNAKPGDALYEKARTGTSAKSGQDYFDILRADVKAGNLPQISWIVAPEAFTEHPNWPVNYGAWYVAQVLDALTSNPEVWSKTALFITYDENDGFFDHVVPAYPAANAAQGGATMDVSNEVYAGGSQGVAGQYGLGVRVPMLVVSPWSRGGWVNSQTFDHTSIVQFMEQRFGVHEPNISAWRRAVCGDLTSAFDFGRTETKVPALPSTAAYVAPDHDRHDSYPVSLPTSYTMPKQEAGSRPARALPYDLSVEARVSGGELRVEFASRGAVGAVFYVTSATDASGPWTYSVEAGKNIAGTWKVAGAYSFTVHGPNGFYREIKGTAGAGGVEVSVRRDATGEELNLVLVNEGPEPAVVTVTNAYGNERKATHRLRKGEQVVHTAHIRHSHGWYDVSVVSDKDAAFVRRIAGHVENGKASFSDPAIITG